MRKLAAMTGVGSSASNKVGAGYARLGRRTGVRRVGGGGPGEFSRRAIGQLASAGAPIGRSSGDELGLAGPLGGLEVARIPAPGRIVQFQRVSGSAQVVVAWLPSHGRSQGIEVARDSGARLLIANLAAGPCLGRIEAAPRGELAAAGAGDRLADRPRGGASPFAIRPSARGVASGGPGVDENRGSASIGRRPAGVPACLRLRSAREFSGNDNGSGAGASFAIGENGSGPVDSARVARTCGSAEDVALAGRESGLGVKHQGRGLSRERIRGGYAASGASVNRRVAIPVDGSAA